MWVANLLGFERTTKWNCNILESKTTKKILFFLKIVGILKYRPFVRVHPAGYLLANDAQGETPLIPSEVMEFSIKHSTEVDINTTLQILGSPGEKASSIPGCNRTDSVIR